MYTGIYYIYFYDVRMKTNYFIFQKNVVEKNYIKIEIHIVSVIRLSTTSTRITELISL